MTSGLFEIYVAYHKPFKLIKNNVTIPIHAGREIATTVSKDGTISKEDLDWLLENTIGDDTGENISAKNRWYSELTVTYWMLKNAKADYVGLMHYRRLFNLSGKNVNALSDNILEKCKITEENLSKIMQEYDIVLPKKIKFNISIYNQYKRFHFIEDLDFVLDIIKEKYPEIYECAKENLSLPDGYYWNMLITSKKIFDDYAEWLFDVLFEFEKHFDKRKDRSIYQQRTESFLAERLSNIYFGYLISTKKLKVLEADVIRLKNNNFITRLLKLFSAKS